MPGEVADPVAVGVRERARVDLVEDAVAPPGRGHLGCRRCRRSSRSWRAQHRARDLRRFPEVRACAERGRNGAVRRAVVRKVARTELPERVQADPNGGVEVSKRLVLLMCSAVLGGGAFLAACGSDDDDGGTAGGGESTGETEGAKTIDVSTMENAKGNVTVCMGKDTGGDVTAGDQGLQRPEERRDREDPRVLDLGRRAAPAVRPAPGGQVRRVRRLLVRRDLDGGVRVAEVALRPHAVHRHAPRRAHRGDARDRDLRRQGLGHAAADRRRLPLLPHRPGQDEADDLAGGLRGRRRTRTASSTRARRTRA